MSSLNAPQLFNPRVTKAKSLSITASLRQLKRMYFLPFSLSDAAPAQHAAPGQQRDLRKRVARRAEGVAVGGERRAPKMMTAMRKRGASSRRAIIKLLGVCLISGHNVITIKLECLFAILIANIRAEWLFSVTESILRKNKQKESL